MVCSALWLAKSLADSSQSHAKNKVVCLKNLKHCTAEPFHFLHMDPMSDVTILGRLCVADCGNTIVCSALWLAKNLADSSQRPSKYPRLFALRMQ
jgi:uncharacterized protein YuzB (UPF0349 family)